MGIGGAIGGLVGLGQGIFGQSAAQSAGNQMAQGNMMAALMQMQMFNQIQQNLQPYMQYGQGAMNALAPLIGIGGDPMTAELTSRFNPTMEQLEQTPGYQFTLGQGLKTLQNQFASKGLGLSGNALRGAADYTTGLASQTYQDQFNNYWNENKNIFGMLSGAQGTGLQAAGMGANAAGQFGQMIGNNLVGAGNAYGNATIGGANALMQGIGNAYGVINSGSGGSSWWNRPVFGQGGIFSWG